MKRGEKLRLEREISKEQRRLHNAESEVKLAEQAFDQFLQENDRNAVTATKRSVIPPGGAITNASLFCVLYDPGVF